MKVLFICGVFDDKSQEEVINETKGYAEFSANIFQKKLIRGFKQNDIDIEVVSAPFIGSYPNKYKKMFFRGFESQESDYRYVNFCNVWGYRNFSRSVSLKKAIANFIQVDDFEKLIVVYSTHTPFLDAAVYAKSKDPRIKICLVIPDLPQYMNLNARISMIYKIGKKFDIAKFKRLNKYVDSYMLLTEAMKDVVDIHGCPYCVIEGIVDPDIFEKKCAKKQKTSNDGAKYIVYTGKTNEKFGIKELVEVFETLADHNLRLVICGSGDSDTYIKQKAKQDSRILVLGQVPHDKAIEWVRHADVLVNPRQDNEEYTKYSFPSKNIEYLSSGNPTVGYILRGMKPIYREFLLAANEDGLGAAIGRALNMSEEERILRCKKIETYMQTLSGRNIALQIIGTAYGE